ncbi:MAG: serpin family protein [Bacteroidales bacterium]|nr:serpin family protein [Bacteroidales bacterium]
MNLINAMMIVLLCLASCDKADPVKNPEPGISYELTKAQSEMVEEGNVFAFDLLEAVSENKEFAGKDFMVSPLSISFVLGALDNGATCQTSEEILDVLGFEGCTVEDLNEYSRNILRGCTEVDDLVDVKIANAVVVKEGYNLKKGFSDALENYYDAYVRSMKFDDKAVDAINDWCNEQTKGLIPKIIDEIPEDALLFALNSIYFKGAWVNRFEKDNTQKSTFTNFDGSNSKTWMMQMEEWLDYSSNDTWSTVRLPYGNGSYSMYVLLPHEGISLDVLIDELDGATWESEKNRMRSCIVNLKLPRFETASDINLNNIMKSLGMKRAFIPGLAEFGDMFENESEIFLGILKQKSRIIVNEEGTEAAGVTMGGVMATGFMPENKPKTFHADRPFVYLIQEKSSNAIFFIGAKVKAE